MSFLEIRILELERRLERALNRVASLEALARQSGQDVQKLWQGGGGGSGGTVPLCLGVTTSAISAASFGGADGTGTATLTFPDGTTGSVTVANRGTTAVANGKNGMFGWVESQQKWYVWGDC